MALRRKSPKPQGKSSKKPSRRAPPRKAAKPRAAKTKPAVEIVEAEPVDTSSGGDLTTLPTETDRAWPIEIDPRRIEETLAKVRDEVSHWAKKGRYSKVRFKFRGKQLLPDLPLAAVVAAEGLTFYWGGLLRLLLMNLGANAVLGVEIINDSEKRIAQGKERLLSGDLEGALQLFEEALGMDRDNPSVHLNLGVARKLKGDREGARQALERAKALDPDGAIGAEAEKVLSTIPAAAVVTMFHPPAG